jgi:beta-glucosidase
MRDRCFLMPATGLLAIAIGWSAIAWTQELTGPRPEQWKPEREAKAPDERASARAPAPRAAVRFDAATAVPEAMIDALIADMSLAEKIGQLCQVAPEGANLSPELGEAIRAGEIGSIINAPSRAYIDEAQRLAREESARGIPLLIGRDVIHGYRTVFPIPLGQAASWNPELVERAAAIAADEARSEGINWTFAPMVDICRDPRWGRIAETLGEDPMLASALTEAMVRGFQQERDGRLQGVVGCVKHFAAYGLAEGGRDYNRVSVSNAELHNVYLRPFEAGVRAGCRTLMTTFNEVNGVPGTAHAYLLGDVLRKAWGFRGLVVSDWNSVIEMIEHGYSADRADAARQALTAGVDMEMVSSTYREHLAELVEAGAVAESDVDEAVRRVLRVKTALPPTDPAAVPRAQLRPRSLEAARRLARESLVLLQNKNDVLPLDANSLNRLAVIGPLADSPKSQLGCWSLDGDAQDTVTPLEALRDALGDSVEIVHARGASADFSTDESGIAEAASVAASADVVLLFVGEDALLSGEARSRADLDLPGVQAKLVEAVAAAGKPTVMVVLAGRPLTIGAQCEAVDAVLYAWHPGTMGGPAIADVLLGHAAPAGRLPVTIPKTVGQAPLYYGHSNTGRPSPKGYRPLTESKSQDLPAEFQYRSHYLDSDPLPLYPFGFGLSYTTFVYDEPQLSTKTIAPGQTLAVTVRITNAGKRAGSEVVQLYVRDLVASLVRPVKELKAFRRVHLRAGESKIVEFALNAEQLGYYNGEGKLVLEPGAFALGVGGDSSVALSEEFELRPSASPQPPSVIARRPEEPSDVRRNGRVAEPAVTPAE